jgi:multiple sugar transport system substrate-binding protein
MKRSVCLILGCLALAMLPGCGKKAEAAKGPAAIDFWYGLGGGLGEAMEAAIKSFNESQNDVVVTGIQQSEYGETARQIQAAIAANQVPSSALFGVHDLDMFMKRGGILERLDDYIAAYPDFNKSDIVQSFFAYCLNEKNEVYGLPAYGTTQIIYYRIDTLRDAGADPDEVFKTWQSLAEFSARVAKKERGETVFYGFEPMGSEANLPDVARSNGARFLSEDGKTALFNTKEWIEAFESMRKWLHEDEIMGIHYGGQGWEYWYKTIDDVMQGRAAGYLGSAGDQGDLDFSIVAAHVQPGFGNHPPKPYADIVTLGILADAPKAQKEAAFKWLAYFSSAPATAQWAMRTGYIPVRSSSVNVPEYAAFIKERPQAVVPLRQAEIAQKSFMDPTGNKINTAIADACELVVLENVPAVQALAELQRTAQVALDEYWAEKDR